LHVNRSRKGNITDGNAVQETSSQEKVTGCKRDPKRMTIPSYDIERMTVEELQGSLQRITENARQPFSFLANISKEFVRDDYDLSTKAKKSTDIDVGG